MAKCVKCGAYVSEEEFRQRYEELAKRGIYPMMVPMCLNCRFTAIDYKKEGK